MRELLFLEQGHLLLMGHFCFRGILIIERLFMKHYLNYRSGIGGQESDDEWRYLHHRGLRGFCFGVWRGRV
jgi:hypothetical protein